jgi:hypothetical protein
MNELSTYIRQRFNISLWFLVALMLIAISLKDFTISLVHVCSIPFVLFFLFIMRLFDDLASAKIDSDKARRDYTNEVIKKELQIILIISQIVLILFLAFFDTERARNLFIFLVVNSILYYLLFNVLKFRYFLPLLKYPFIIYILNLEPTFNLIAVYGAFVIFEMLEDPLFPNYLLTNYNVAIPEKKMVPYVFLLFFLLTQIILKNV